MKLVRFGDKGFEHPGLVDADYRVRDLSAHVADFEGEMLAPAILQSWARSTLRLCRLHPQMPALVLPSHDPGTSSL